MATPAVQAASCAGAATAVITTTVVVVPTADARPAYSVYTAAFNENSKLGKEVWMLLIDHSQNQDWWEWSFRQLEAHKNSKDLDPSFKSLTSGFSKENGDGTANSKELNKFCHHLFKTENTTTITNPTVKDNSIWKYCSPLGKLPVLIQDEKSETYASGNLGESKKAELISYSSFSNSIFWELKNNWFQKLNPAPTDLFFKEFLGKDKHLKEACKKAYSTTAVNNGSSSATADKPSSTDVVKYCGFKVTQ